MDYSNQNAIGIVSKAGRYGGTYAHLDIAYEFASWISAEFKLFLIKEFQRLKQEENLRLEQGWDIKRMLAKINYKIHTDAVKAHLIPANISKNRINIVNANEADVLNVALFGKTAKEWRDENKGKDGNIRDYADVTLTLEVFLRDNLKMLQKIIDNKSCLVLYYLSCLVGFKTDIPMVNATFITGNIYNFENELSHSVFEDLNALIPQSSL